MVNPLQEQLTFFEEKCAVIASIVRRTTLDVKQDGNFYPIFESTKEGETYLIEICYKDSDWIINVKIDGELRINYFSEGYISMKSDISYKRWDLGMMPEMDTCIEILKTKIKTSKRTLKFGQ